MAGSGDGNVYAWSVRSGKEVRLANFILLVIIPSPPFNFPLILLQTVGLNLYNWSWHNQGSVEGTVPIFYAILLAFYIEHLFSYVIRLQ